MTLAILTDSYLDAMRQVGDEEVDPIVEHVLALDVEGHRPGRMRYNFMMDLADRIVATPSLRFVPDSVLNRQLGGLPEPIRAYFTPMVAPEWVDADKLALGARLWQQNRLMMLSVLYSASLPACYLIAKGIPALYDTAKLLERRYLFQRIYETGLMLDAVMGEDGVRVVRDIAHGGDEVRRYLWGEGFVTAKKVRFLHASMRYMLTHHKRDDEAAAHAGHHAHPRVTDRLAADGTGWNAEELGAPVNQEDLAYTLLTFGYLLPRGMERWGCPVSAQEREAFLHLWRTIGHVMGIHDALTTDDWDEAARLFETLKARQGRSSSQGMALTESLLGFLSAYMPSHDALANHLSALLMMSQLGKADARKLLAPELVESVGRFPWPLLLWLGTRLLRVFYLVRKIPTAGVLLRDLLDDVSESLIASWRGEYARRPFYVPAHSNEWKQRAGADEAFMRRLRQWRRRLFRHAATGVGLLGVSVLALVSVVPVRLWGSQIALDATLAIAATSLLGAVAMMKLRLPAVCAERPRLPTEFATETSESERNVTPVTDTTRGPDHAMS